MNRNRRDFVRLMSSVASMPLMSPLTCGSPGRPHKSSTTLDFAKPPGSVEILNDFPALHQKINGFPLVYLDSAATTHRSRAVIDGTSNFYAHDNANPSLALHALARRSAELYDEARRIVAQFIHARSPDEIIWTRGTTEAINLAASSWGAAHLRPGDEILVTQAEHYSNLLPWRFLAQRMQARLRFLEVDDEGRIQLDRLGALLTVRTKMVAFTH